MKLSEHFSDTEFRCECGCGKKYTVPADLVNKLETLYSLLDKLYGVSKIIITSGFRCIDYGVKNGFCTREKPDGHCKNIAVDFKVYDKQNKTYNPELIAMGCEVVGFSGIGIMNTAVHADIRNSNNYYNSKWFGDERSGKSYNSFKDFSVFDYTTLKNAFEKTDSTVIARFTIDGKNYGVIRL